MTINYVGGTLTVISEPFEDGGRWWVMANDQLGREWSVEVDKKL